MYLPLPVVLIFVLAVLLPVGWVVSEFQPRRWLRILCGGVSLGVCGFVAIAVGTLERLN